MSCAPHATNSPSYATNTVLTVVSPCPPEQHIEAFSDLTPLFYDVSTLWLKVPCGVNLHSPKDIVCILYFLSILQQSKIVNIHAYLVKTDIFYIYFIYLTYSFSCLYLCVLTCSWPTCFLLSYFLLCLLLCTKMPTQILCLCKRIWQSD